jgi:DNA-binding response OmpR family regulator
VSRVLVVDDDVEFCEMLAEYLEPEGFTVELAHDGETGVAKALSATPDLVVLDVMLPRVNGFDALRRIRHNCAVPVLMLTARGEDVDRIVGLEMGADDYLPKPCNPRELVARLRAILRRSQDRREGTAAEHVRVGDLELFPGLRQIRMAGEALMLTSTEYNLLEVLIRQAGRVVTKAELSERAMGRKLTRYDRSIDMHMSKIRRKLGDTVDGRPRIETIRGVGYQLIAD